MLLLVSVLVRKAATHPCMCLQILVCVLVREVAHPPPDLGQPYAKRQECMGVTVSREALAHF